MEKGHSILAYHQVREAIASNILAYHWIQTGYNLSDMLSKHWDHPSVYSMIMQLLITRGPSALITQESTQENPLKFPSSRVLSKQLTSLQEGSNRISPRPPSFEVLQISEL